MFVHVFKAGYLCQMNYSNVTQLEVGKSKQKMVQIILPNLSRWVYIKDMNYSFIVYKETEIERKTFNLILYSTLYTKTIGYWKYSKYRH